VKDRQATVALVRHAVKTAIAGTACFYLAQALRLPEPYWAVISAVIVMASSVGGTLGAAWYRLAGTAIGVTAGAIAFVLAGPQGWAFGIAVAAVILLCGVLRLSAASRLAGVAVAIVMLVGRQRPPWVIAAHRFLEVSLGIVVGVLVTVLVWPERAAARVRQRTGEAFEVLGRLFGAIVARCGGDLAAPVEDLRRRASETLRSVEECVRSVRYERRPDPREREAVRQLAAAAGRLFEGLQALEIATREGSGDTFRERFEPELGELEAALARSFDALAASARTGRAELPAEPLLRASSALEEKAGAVRREGVSTRYTMREILRWYAFLLGLESLAREAERAAADFSALNDA
jgi:uncharacterized membrane protein YgaE (UPF0421/DUF939 family)